MKADFAMAIHFHQPVGNFDHVMERACDKCYMPFLETLERYPSIKMTFHFSGCLLEWAGNKRPEMIEKIRSMAESGQVEMMAGGFYEPILPSIPYRDRVSQIKMLRDYVRANFSQEPKGAWVAERVWEPGLPSVFHETGIKYVILDDTHFLYSGIPKDRTYGYYMTEDAGKTVAVFPSDKVLRYNIPFKMPSESIGYMRSVLERNGEVTFIYGDDGEKFGEWPGTHKWVYEEKWLEKFFDEIARNSEWINTVTLSECLEKKAPLGRVYLPTCSYEEMLEWALPAGTQQWLEDVMKDIKSSGKEDFYKPFIRGGFWRNFFAKYPESNHMNKKMIYVSRKLEDLRGSRHGKGKDLAEARRDLLRGQCNCAYWHGVFGGLYLFHLRRAIYYHLIKSEKEMDRIRYGEKQFCEATVLDIDADGHEDVVLENRETALYIDPADGGTIKEADSRTACQNLVNSLARRKEAYHRKVLEKIARQREAASSGNVQTIHDNAQAADPALKEHLSYDRYGRYGLIDHFLGRGTDIRSFSGCSYREAGDFVNAKYGFEINKKNKGVSVNMKREGRVDSSRIYIEKEITLPKKGSYFSVDYLIANRESGSVELLFAPEFNVTMPDCDSDQYTLVAGEKTVLGHLSDLVEEKRTGGIRIKDGKGFFSWQMSFSDDCILWHFPVKTVSQSEKAYELNYQSSAIVPVFCFRLGPGEEKKIGLRFDLDLG